MNLIRSSFSIRSILVPRRRQAAGPWSRRGMCITPVKPEVQPLRASQPVFQVPGLRPSNLDKKIFIWSGRFKSQDQIPELVSPEMINAARNKVRVKVCMIMIGVTIVACVVTVIMGKQAVGRNESLTSINLERKARLRESAQQEMEATSNLSNKTE